MEVKMDIIEILLLIGLIVATLITKIPHKEEKSKLSKEDMKKLEEAKKAFNNLMEYDYDAALKRK